MEGPWPLCYEPPGGDPGDPGDGEWTCDPWEVENVQVIHDSVIPSFSVDVASGVTQVVVDAVDFTGGRSAWRVDLPDSTDLELFRERERDWPHVGNPLGEITDAELLSGRQCVRTCDTTLDAKTTAGFVHRLDELPTVNGISSGEAVQPVGGGVFLHGAWRDDDVYLGGSTIETVEYQTASPRLTAVLTLEEQRALGGLLRWRFDFARLTRFYFRLDMNVSDANHGLVASAFVDEDHFLLAGSSCTLMVQSARVTASPMPD